MSSIEAVALWVGLIASIVGIVLSVVAMVFAYLVDQRSREATNQTIQSLQKIETTVERISSDNAGLVKAAWDKWLLGDPQAVLSAREGRPQSTPTDTAASDGEYGLATRRRSRVDMVIAQLANVSPAAVELARLLARRRHLTHDEYHALAQSSDYIRGALSDLRDVGLLVRLHHEGHDGPVYWFPSAAVDNVLPAAALLGRGNPTAAQRVEVALREAEQHAGRESISVDDGAHEASAESRSTRLDDSASARGGSGTP